MRGRKPKPTRLKLIAGNPGRRPLNPAEPQIPASVPEPPPNLSAAALAEWHRLAPALARAGILTAFDRAALGGYCAAWGSFVDAEEALRSGGAVITGYRGSPVVNPHCRVRDRALELMARFAAELGLTPSSRSRIHATPPGDGDPADRFFADAPRKHLQ